MLSPILSVMLIIEFIFAGYQSFNTSIFKLFLDLKAPVLYIYLSLSMTSQNYFIDASIVQTIEFNRNQRPRILFHCFTNGGTQLTSPLTARFGEYFPTQRKKSARSVLNCVDRRKVLCPPNSGSGIYCGPYHSII